ncbi:MAG: nucleotide pyrophosphohydrolase [Saprospiraceae bacterium]|nr:nucleotide pyrophosphohydrolase [Saprospiraceae bacterium]
MNKYQEQTDQWIRQFGVRYFDERTNMLLLVEEVGELSRWIARKYGEQSFKEAEDEKNVDNHIEDEMADVFFVFCCLANQMNIDIDRIFERNLDKKTNRDSDRHHSNKKLKSERD